uniref:RING-type E3 ubiquitin transferase n=1 Tax=Timema monikensis TaxID=170555 RepID=A0A7R9EDC8_9NEOP|nr:unnamed protein product [Timema monikensis]
MAEAAVEDSSISKFFCHKCSAEIPSVLPDFTCPTCYSGFIEKIDAPPEVEDNGDDMDVENFPTFEQHLAQALDQRLSVDLSRDLVQILSVGHAAMDERRAGIEDRRVVRGRERDTSGPDTRRPGRYGSVMSRTVRNRGPRANRQMAPIENLIQEFIVNLTGVGWGTVTAGRGANGPVFFLGNPGDYAWGREGLDAIVTQLLNQMDGTGPPPLARDKIDEIPIVLITLDQVGKSLQCSVCWEDFRAGEPVRKLKCEHFYHEGCIVPWLELHGTCPICRKSMGEEGFDDQSGSGGGGMNSMGAANDSASSRASSTSSNSSTSTSSSSAGGSSGSSTTSHSHPSPDFNIMDLEFD